VAKAGRGLQISIKTQIKAASSQRRGRILELLKLKEIELS